MYAFDYHRPASVRQAAGLLAKKEDAKLLAGGHTLLPTLKLRLANPANLIDLGRIDDLRGIEIKGRSIVIGAMTTHGAVATSEEIKAVMPGLCEMAGLIGDPAVRSKGTIGGSVANNDPSADYPAACLALGATIITNTRKIEAADFFTGIFSTALDEGEIITKISFPIAQRYAYAKFRNPASRYAIVGVAVAKRGDGPRVAVTGSGADGVFRWTEAEEALKARFAPKSLEGLTMSPAKLNGDIHASTEYRAHLIAVMAKRAVTAAVSEGVTEGGAGCGGDTRGAPPRWALRARQRTRCPASASCVSAVGGVCKCARARLYRTDAQGVAVTSSESSSRRDHAVPTSIGETLSLLEAGGYIGERSLATVLFLALRMGRPLFLEGEAGVGKTEIAKVLASTLGRTLIRLQCYEGLDVASAVYEWNYAGQMMAIRLAEAAGETDRSRLSRDVFSEEFLVRRPLLRALEPDVAGPPILLIDELDRADEAFEAFLLEVLSDFQVTIPELGVVKAAEPPIVIITSNRTREIHDALKRRCLYHWVDYPDAERELAILRAKAPRAPATLSRQIVAFIQRIRQEDLFKAPGVAEALDWASALVELDAVALDPALVSDTLGVLLKYQDDIAKMQGGRAKALLDEAKAAA